MLRFTIRDVLWLTLVVGLALGWALDRGRLADRAEAAENRLEDRRKIHEWVMSLPPQRGMFDRAIPSPNDLP